MSYKFRIINLENQKIELEQKLQINLKDVDTHKLVEKISQTLDFDVRQIFKIRFYVFLAINIFIFGLFIDKNTSESLLVSPFVILLVAFLMSVISTGRKIIIHSLLSLLPSFFYISEFSCQLCTELNKSGKQVYEFDVSNLLTYYVLFPVMKVICVRQMPFIGNYYYWILEWFMLNLISLVELHYTDDKEISKSEILALQESSQDFIQIFTTTFSELSLFVQRGINLLYLFCLVAYLALIVLLGLLF